MSDEKTPTLWVLSNRRDDRVVLFERDPSHPGGEAFVGGAGPAHVARTGTVERLLRDGLLLEIPEPPDGPKKPRPTAAVEEGTPAAQPGQEIPLGRELDPDLVPAHAMARLQKRQEELPDSVPVPAETVVPPPVTSERETRRR